MWLMDELDRYRAVLGLPPGASPQELDQTYRDLVKVWHPDRFGHDPRLRQKADDKLKEINAAYEALKGWSARPAPPKPEGHTQSHSAGSRESAPKVPEPPRPERPAPARPRSRKQRPLSTAVSWTLAAAATVGFAATVILLAPYGARQEDRSVETAPAAATTHQSQVESAPARHRAAPIAQPYSPPPPAQEFFTVGSTKEQVLAIQGAPTERQDDVWKYGGSAIYFSGDRVVHWEAAEGSPLKAQALDPRSLVMLSVPDSQVSMRKFGIGSSKYEVLAIQGSPTEVRGQIWKYGESSVVFDGDTVVKWNSKPDFPLQVRRWRLRLE